MSIMERFASKSLRTRARGRPAGPGGAQPGALALLLLSLVLRIKRSTFERDVWAIKRDHLLLQLRQFRWRRHLRTYHRFYFTVLIWHKSSAC